MAVERSLQINTRREVLNLPGLHTYTETMRMPDGRPQNIAVTELYPRSGYTVKPVLASEVCGVNVATLAEIMSNSPQALVGITGNMFILGEILGGFGRNVRQFYQGAVQVGHPLGCFINDGNIIWPPIFGRPGFSVDAAGNFSIHEGLTLSNVQIETNRAQQIQISGTNPQGPFSPNHYLAFTPSYPRPLSPQAPPSFTQAAIVGNTVVAVRNSGHGLPIPKNGYIIAGAELELQPCDVLRYTLIGHDAIQHHIECGPLLVQDGKTLKLDPFELILQGFDPHAPPAPRFNSVPDHVQKFAPRTIIGTRNNGDLVLAVFEGRQIQTNIPGVTLPEAAEIMQSYLDCVSALALDGGASANMIVNQSGIAHELLKYGVATGRAAVNGLLKNASRFSETRFAHRMGIYPSMIPPAEGKGMPRPISNAILVIPKSED